MALTPEPKEHQKQEKPLTRSTWQGTEQDRNQETATEKTASPLGATHQQHGKKRPRESLPDGSAEKPRKTVKNAGVRVRCLPRPPGPGEQVDQTATARTTSTRNQERLQYAPEKSALKENLV